MAEWDAERARSDAGDEAEAALRNSVRRRNEEARTAFELAHLDERTAGRAFGFKPYEARCHLRDLVNRGLLRRVEGPREIGVDASLAVLRELETNEPLCHGGPFYLRDDVLALRRDASAGARDGLTQQELRTADDLLSEVLRFVLCASR
jgi:hypothetical protein